MPQIIEIEGQKFEVLDAKEKMTVPDCFVGPHNKTGKGHGEAKFYVGQRNDNTFTFFDNINRRCFFLKSDIIKYLDEVKSEYIHPQQPYRKRDLLPQDWKKYTNESETIDDQILYFKLKFQSHLKGPRFYLNSDDKVYSFIRLISLPKITYLSSLKLKDTKGEVLYYFRLFVDYFGEEAPIQVIKNEEKGIKDDNKIKPIEKEYIIRARQGQGKYRDGVLKECPFCPITMVTDDRILIASHIKPWIKSDIQEKIDPKNGFMFTPTYDFLFDRGYISFNDNQTIIISPWLSNMTLSKLNLSPGKRYPMLPIKGKEKYLQYHRENILKR